MELLNNIWNALTTPNECLINILSIPFTIIETTLLMFLFISILDIKSNYKNKILYISVISIISILSNFLLTSPFNLIINYTFMIIFIHLLFKTNVFKTIIAFIIPIIIFALIGMFIMNPYLAIANISFDSLSTIPLYRITYVFLQYIIAFAIYIFFKKKHLSLKIFDEIDKKNKKIIYANLIFGIFTLLIEAVITVYYIDNLPLIITFLSFLSMLAYFRPYEMANNSFVILFNKPCIGTENLLR